LRLEVVMPKSFKKLLVANRGEIAIRIFRAATELKIPTVAVYSWEDRLSIHRYKADEAWQVGEEGEPLKAYLDIDAILELAVRRGVDAIHPGYGFLSERADFARRCAEVGITFIGPPPEAIDKLGDKVSARTLAIGADVPVIPGTDAPLRDADEAVRFASEVGYPIMLKAAYGGGGRGMRRCFDEASLKEAFEAATREAKTAFGRGEVFLEKLIQKPRHIEVQVLGDLGGNIVHLFERDCSIQRRHQKVVEVAPAAGIGDDVREALYADALKVASAAGLANAATVEFLLDEDGTHYFIEVNPRVQVEHTITELITGVDIVQSQIRIAAGASLADLGLGDQSAIVRRGAAIEARVTTEDPLNDFAPDTGRLTAYRSAAGFGIRLDPGVAGAGAIITPHYDSLLVKVSSFALTHEQASTKLLRSLAEFRIRGVATNIPFLENIIGHPTFRAGEADTGFVERTTELFEFPRRKNRATRILRALGETIVNGPPGVDNKLERPPLLISPPPPPRLPHERDGRSFKRILDDEGPEAVAKAVKDTKRLLLTDTTLRDAHQSLLATRLRTHDMLRAAGAMADRMPGVFSFECWGGATFDVAYRFLREDPWDRLRKLRERLPDTLLQMLLRGSNAVGYTNYPTNVVRQFVRIAAREGIDVFRIFDCFNQLDAMKVSIDEVREQGAIAEVCICFTGDFHDESRPLYTLDYYRRKAREITAAGAHMIAIKDMAGLLKPHAATELMAALKDETDLPIHLHTHDTSGNGVAMLLMAAAAGVDIVDGAASSMSGLTSQPSLDAVVAALRGSERDTGMDPDRLQELADYWEGVRTAYRPFESGLMASTGDVYKHEIPGGQYSNLKPQALAVGLADQWPEVRERYREVNFAFGDLIKVTPSSKVVGDFALWLVRNHLTCEEYLNAETAYDVPVSVVEFFKGAIGVPEGGFPEKMRARVLGDDALPPPTKPASEGLPDYDFDAARADLEKLAPMPVTDTLEMAYALYPKVIKDYLAYRTEFSDTSVLSTSTFLYGLEPDEEVSIDIEDGKSLIVRRSAVGALREDGRRECYFMLNGQPRSVLIKDRAASTGEVERPRADPTHPGHVGAPMPGQVLSLHVKAGDKVEEGDKLAVLEAMKLETVVRAPSAGTLADVLVRESERVDAGDLIFVLAD
jgi:pyruvate carboxylase